MNIWMGGGEVLQKIDRAITASVNQFAGHNPTVDILVEAVSSSHLFKGIPFAIVFCVYWLSNRTDHLNRSKVISACIVGIIAILVGRALAIFLPHRARPFVSETFDANIPIGMEEYYFTTWTSFPSDHALLFVALAGGVYFLNKRLGLIALAYTAVFICLPRVYLGLHYFGDVLVGAVIGAVIAALLLAPMTRLVNGSRLYAIAAKWPVLKTCAFVSYMYLMVHLYQPMRDAFAHIVVTVF